MVEGRREGERERGCTSARFEAAGWRIDGDDKKVKRDVRLDGKLNCLLPYV